MISMSRSPPLLCLQKNIINLRIETGRSWSAHQQSEEFLVWQAKSPDLFIWGHRRPWACLADVKLTVTPCARRTLKKSLQSLYEAHIINTDWTAHLAAHRSPELGFSCQPPYWCRLHHKVYGFGVQRCISFEPKLY